MIGCISMVGVGIERVGETGEKNKGRRSCWWGKSMNKDEKA